MARGRFIAIAISFEKIYFKSFFARKLKTLFHTPQRSWKSGLLFGTEQSCFIANSTGDQKITMTCQYKDEQARFTTTPLCEMDA
jgi:hypothetical protein